MQRLSLAAAALLLTLAPLMVASAHERHGHFSAGVPGDPKRPARVIKVKMREEGNKMLFVPDRIEVRRGEQIRFVLQNEGHKRHEFVLATAAENRKHGQEMKKNPDMEHDDPNGKQVPEYLDDELLWRFTKRGEFEFACLIPGHYEAGMYGKVVVR